MIRRSILAVLALALLVGGCATTPPVERAAPAPPPVAAGDALRRVDIDPALAERILALDPEHVTDQDVRGVLALGPTPRIVLLHGGIYPVHLVMESFSRFLEGMGYPQAKLRHPGDKRRSHSPYENSLQLAGLVGWYYEHEGMMPMLVGHSQGGIQLVKVLYELAGSAGPSIAVWNPLTDAAENRTTIVDPYSGAERPVVGLKVGYASVVGAGGAALLLPNQWSMAGKLKAIPDSVEDFTGYALGVDLIAWNLPGSGPDYRANGAAKVRNVELPAEYSHVFVAQTSHLAREPAMRAWINAYAPGSVPELPTGVASTDNSLWAADVWYDIKKHWVIEAQRFVRAKRLIAAEPDH